MNTLNIGERHEPRLASWLRHVAMGLLGLVLVVSLVLSFAVEFMASGVDSHRRAQSSLNTGDVAAGVYAHGDQPSRPVP